MINTTVKAAMIAKRVGVIWVINKPVLPSKMAVYIGCRINLYGPAVISTASAAGCGNILSLLFCILMIAQITRMKEMIIAVKDNADRLLNKEPASNRNIKIN